MFDLSSKSPEQKSKMVIRALGVEAVLAWRLPSADEYVSYQTARMRKTAHFQRDHGLAILTGIRDGDFGIDGKPLSSDPESPDYRADWKEALAANPVGLSLVEGLAFTVFEETYSVPVGAIPFEKS